MRFLFILALSAAIWLFTTRAEQPHPRTYSDANHEVDEFEAALLLVVQHPDAICNILYANCVNGNWLSWTIYQLMSSTPPASVPPMMNSGINKTVAPPPCLDNVWPKVYNSCYCPLLWESEWFYYSKDPHATVPTPQAYYELACNLYNSANVELNNIAEGNTIKVKTIKNAFKHNVLLGCQVNDNHTCYLTRIGLCYSGSDQSWKPYDCSNESLPWTSSMDRVCMPHAQKSDVPCDKDPVCATKGVVYYPSIHTESTSCKST